MFSSLVFVSPVSFGGRRTTPKPSIHVVLSLCSRINHVRNTLRAYLKIELLGKSETGAPSTEQSTHFTGL